MKVAIIGCGNIAQVHAKCISLFKEHELCGAADCDFNKAVVLTEKYGGKPYCNWLDMIESVRPEVVHICTPHNLHAEMTCEILKRNIHVFTEKPPVTDVIQFRALDKAYEAAVNNNIRLAVCFQNRLNPETEYAKDIINEGKLGRVTGMRGIVTWNRDYEYYNACEWRGKAGSAGGGALINQGIHTLDLIQYFAGEHMTEADSVMNNFHLKGRIEVEDTCAAYIRYPTLNACFYTTCGYCTDSPPLIDIEFEKGRVRIEGDEVLLCSGATEPERTAFRHEKVMGKSYWGASHKKAIEMFYKSIEGEKDFILDYCNVRDTIELMLLLYKKAYENISIGGY